MADSSERMTTTHQAAHVAVLEAARDCALSHLGLLIAYDMTDDVEETRALIDRLTAAIELMKQAVKASIAGRPLYLFGREHFEDKQKPMAEIELGMEMDGYVVFHMKDPNQPVPAAPTEASR